MESIWYPYQLTAARPRLAAPWRLAVCMQLAFFCCQGCSDHSPAVGNTPPLEDSPGIDAAPVVDGSSAPEPAAPEQSLHPSTSLPEPSVPTAPRADHERDDNSLKLKLVWCPPGTFLMGSPATDWDAFVEEKPQVAVTLSDGFWLGKYEVTQGQWVRVMGTVPWKGKPYVKEGANYPAMYVSFGDALEFCHKLSELERGAGRLPAGEEYTLPTEAQWEYACRAATTTRYSFGDDASKLANYAWYEENATKVGDDYAHTVGLKKANDWGLHDMHGNVFEWCLDGYKGKLPGGRDPFVKHSLSRVSRGGGWNVPAGGLRSATRWPTPSIRDFYLGFRLLLSASAQ